MTIYYLCCVCECECVWVCVCPLMCSGNSINSDNKLHVIFTHYSVCFDSVVYHKFLNNAFKEAGASQKSCVIFRVIYKSFSSVTEVPSTDGNTTCSDSFHINRGASRWSLSLILSRKTLTSSRNLLSLHQCIVITSTTRVGLIISLPPLSMDLLRTSTDSSDRVTPVHSSRSRRNIRSTLWSSFGDPCFFDTHLCPLSLSSLSIF